MKVIGYAPISTPPFVPKFVLTPDGLFDRNGKPADGQTAATHTVDINFNEWVGVNHQGVIETFRISEEQTWRAKEAGAVIAKVASILSPEQQLATIRAAAQLVGLDLPSLLDQLEQHRQPGENLADVWLRTKCPPVQAR